MTDRSVFRIYSMTKTVTAVAAMILLEEGLFELSDPVSDFLPQFGEVVVLQEDGSTRAPSRPVTVQDLLLHTAGLSHRSSREYREAGVRSVDTGFVVTEEQRGPFRWTPRKACPRSR
jgi:CubicO group peptidase (beta-lactamase class C family)